MCCCLQPISGCVYNCNDGETNTSRAMTEITSNPSSTNVSRYSASISKSIVINSRGIILDDVELIESLKVSKEISKAVNDKIIISVKKEEELIKGYTMFDPIL